METVYQRLQDPGDCDWRTLGSVPVGEGEVVGRVYYAHALGGLHWYVVRMTGGAHVVCVRIHPDHGVDDRGSLYISDYQAPPVADALRALACPSGG